MYIANGKHFDNYEHLENWCIDHGLQISKVQPVSKTITLAQVIELDEMDAEVRRAQRRERESQEQEFAVDRKYYGR
jgi:hypothetical protein